MDGGGTIVVMGVWVLEEGCLKVHSLRLFTYCLRVDGMQGKYCTRDEGELPAEASHTEADARKEDTDDGVQQDVGQMEQLWPQSKE